LSVLNGPEEGAVRSREVGAKHVHFISHFMTR